MPPPEDTTEALVAPSTVAAGPIVRRYNPKLVPFLGLEDGEQCKIYLAALRESGAYIRAATAVNADHRKIAAYRKDEPEFQALCDDALKEYGFDIIRVARDRAVNGYEVPVIGGRNRDEIVATEVRYETNLTAMFLKKVDPEFNDKATVKVEATVERRFDYSKYSQHVRDQMRILIRMIKEDDEARARGETVI